MDKLSLVITQKSNQWNIHVIGDRQNKKKENLNNNDKSIIVPELN
jgi:hypothetical protein